MSSNLSPDHVEAVFKCLLGRSPDGPIDPFLAMPTLDDLIQAVASMPEAVIRQRSGTLWNYDARFDALDVMRRHADPAPEPVAGRIVNYLGVSINPAVYPPLLAGREGTIEPLPLPANWHADIAEFAAALRAVDLATGRFRMLEMGCGWGCWILNTGVAARRKGLDVRLSGLEGDTGYVELANAGCLENGFAASQIDIRNAVAGPRSGVALFPRQEIGERAYGLQPIFHPTPAQVEEARSPDSRFRALDVLTISSLAGDGVLDLVHIDIQGGEADLVESCIEDFESKVAYTVIGTHSREIEGRLISTFLPRGWKLEVERPAIFSYEADGGRTLRIDGVQGWRNPRLRPDT